MLKKKNVLKNITLIMLVELVSKSLLSTIYLTSGWYGDHKKSTNAFM
jgi:hypothetical protein